MKGKVILKKLSLNNAILYSNQVKFNSLKNKYSNLAPLKQDCVSFRGSKKDFEITGDTVQYLANYGIEKNSSEFNKVIELMRDKGLSLEAAADIISTLKGDDEKIERCAALIQNIQNGGNAYNIAYMVRADISNEDIEKITGILKAEDEPQRVFEGILYSSDTQEAARNLFAIKDLIEDYDLDVTLSELSNYTPEEQKAIIDFMIEQDLDFYQAIEYLDAIKRKKPTNADDIYPKELSQEELLQKYGSKINWHQIQYDMYNQIRRMGIYCVNYQEDNFSGSYGELCRVIENNPKVKIKNTNPWSKRQAPEAKFEHITDRISLNVKGDSDLIKKLDDLMAATGNVFKYKTFSNPANWGDREDPITIYFQDEVSDEMFNKIAQITKPYARGRINGTPETSPTPWMMKEKYSQGVMIDELLQRAKTLDNDLYQDILETAGTKKSMSSGKYRAYLKIMDEYERFLQI